jgi:hypothetical protein
LQVFAIPSAYQLEQFVQTNGHIPNTPTKEQVMQTGIEMGNHTALLLKKNELLTLYMIAKQKEIDALKK